MVILSVRKLTSLRQKIQGLIGKEQIEPIYFETRWGIHTFFVKKSIDVIILDQQGLVQKIKINLQPNRIFIWNPVFYRVVELPAGTVKKQKIMQGVTRVKLAESSCEFYKRQDPKH